MMVSIFALSAFLLGSVPVGLLVSRARGIDIRKHGSGNIGATNVLRTVGKKEALFTLVGDIMKGFVPVIAARLVLDDLFSAGLVGLAAIAGHDFSIFLKLRGGKGVATSIGVLLAYAPVAGVTVVAIWVLTFYISRISSLSALVAFVCLPVISFFIDNSEGKFLISCIITALIVLRHRGNIRRLLSGEEGGMGRKA